VYYSDLEDIEEIGWDRLIAAHRELREFLRENFLS
jgi:hypothetical protein